MSIVIDTSSLMILVRYYLPFDKDNSLKLFIKETIASGEIIILDAVYQESRFISKGLIVEKLEFLGKKMFNTLTILPDDTFFDHLEKQFCNLAIKKKLNDSDYEVQKNKYLNTADAKLILFCIKDKDSLELNKPLLVTEETKTENDNKLFKKIPNICDILDIEHCNLPTLFKDHFKIQLSDFLN